MLKQFYLNALKALRGKQDIGILMSKWCFELYGISLCIGLIAVILVSLILGLAGGFPNSPENQEGFGVFKILVLLVGTIIGLLGLILAYIYPFLFTVALWNCAGRLQKPFSRYIVRFSILGFWPVHGLICFFVLSGSGILLSYIALYFPIIMQLLPR